MINQVLSVEMEIWSVCSFNNDNLYLYIEPPAPGAEASYSI